MLKNWHLRNQGACILWFYTLYPYQNVENGSKVLHVLNYVLAYENSLWNYYFTTKRFELCWNKKKNVIKNHGTADSFIVCEYKRIMSNYPVLHRHTLKTFSCNSISMSATYILLPKYCSLASAILLLMSPLQCLSLVSKLQN